MPRIEAEESVRDPPVWARLERDLIDFMDDTATPIIDSYVAEDGSLLWPTDDDHVGIDGHDDAYESFWNWPLYYVLGGHERYLELSKREYEAIIDQFSAIETPFGHPMAVDEYEQCRDWFHHGEGNLLFYNLCLADPTDDANRERAERFAGLYLPDADVPNYDDEHNVVRAPQTGSMGPEYCDLSAVSAATPFGGYGAEYIWETHSLPFQDIPGIDTIADIKDPDNEDVLFEYLEDRCERGDVPMNLAISGLMANAYLLTGEDKYRDWVREYAQAWLDRTKENDGIIPDNVGLSGEIGEYIDGKWYGGFYGWTWSGWRVIGAAAIVAAETATLLEYGDPQYLKLVRSTLSTLVDNAIERPADGGMKTKTYVPHKYGDPGNYQVKGTFDGEETLRDADGSLRWEDGWFLFQPMDDANYSTHLWYASMDDTDRERIDSLGDPETRAEDYLRPTLENKRVGGHERAWLRYLNGEYPDYPKEILELDLYQSRQRIDDVRADDQPPEMYDDYYLQRRNPIVEEGLLQLTMGAPQQVYNGGLVHARLRHFDPARERPGLPPNVAALVEEIEEDRTVVTLVNLGSDYRDLIVQGGAYGEHEFVSVSTGEDEFAIEESTADVGLPANTRTTLEFEVSRFANDPSYDFPWTR